MEQLNELETEILNAVSKKYPVVKEHLPVIAVKEREITGIGMYIGIIYSGDVSHLPKISPHEGSFGTGEVIRMEGMEEGLAYLIFTHDGLLQTIEIVGIGENWDGQIRPFHLEPFPFLKEPPK